VKQVRIGLTIEAPFEPERGAYEHGHGADGVEDG
jgi:hypothetical protein